MTTFLNRAQWLLVAVMFAAAAVVYSVAPDRITVHWSLTGQPNGYADKLPGLFGLPAIALLVMIGVRVLPRLDPIRNGYVEFALAYAVACTAVVAVLAAVHGVVLAWALGYPISVPLVIAPMVGLLLIVVGAVMAQLRPNWFFGIRTPWTLSSDRSWTATHRAGRWVLIAMGLAIALAGVVQTSVALYVALGVCLVGIIGLVVYSYVVWRDDPDRRRRLA